MKVSYPLSLKVSLWLLANLLLLAAAAFGFLVVQGGLGWNALLAGPAGEHIQSTANVIAGEAAATPAGEAREAVLKRFGASHGAEFSLLRMDESSAARLAALPAAVRTRLEFWPQGRGPGGEFGRPFGPGERGGRGERGGLGRGPPSSDQRRGALENSRGDTPPNEVARRDSPLRGGDRGRFIVRTTAPAAYWIGLRVPFLSSERSRPTPSLLIARVDSLWGLLRLLSLQSWLFAGTVVVLLSVLFWLPLVHGITRALSQLTSATEQIADGRFDTRVPADRRDEIGRLGESVNRMAARLDAHMNGQKRFLGDVAHELCSPLARLQMASGILADTAPAHLRETVTDLREEVQQMSALVNELLLFTKAGLHPRDIVLSPVELAPLVQGVLDRESATGRVTPAVAPGLRVSADADLLSRALGNLVRNAVRYAGDTGAITVGAQLEGHRVVITVEDEGPGVPPEALDRLGEPFFRPEAARTRDAGGVGLGLSIVRNSVAACGGEVRFANRVPRGFRAEIRLGAA